MFFLVGTQHSVCRSARLLTRVSSAEQTGALLSVRGAKWPGVSSVLPLNTLLAHGGVPPTWGTPALSERHLVPASPAARVPFPRFPAPPHTDPFGEAFRGIARGGCGAAAAPRGPTQAFVTEFSPHTTSRLQPGVGKKEPVFPEPLLVLCPHRGPVGASAPAGPALFICAPRGSWGALPPHSLHPGKERESKVTEVAR